MLTNIGYESIKQRIKEKAIEPPKDMNSEQLCNWLLGYRASQIDTFKIINELEEGQRE